MWRSERPASSRTSLIVAVIGDGLPLRQGEERVVERRLAERRLVDRRRRPRRARRARRAGRRGPSGAGSESRRGALVELGLVALEHAARPRELAAYGERDVHAAVADARLELRRACPAATVAPAAEHDDLGRPAGRPPRGTAWSAERGAVVRPGRRSRPTCRRGCAGSRPVVGSSRKTTGRCTTRQAARSSRRRMPPRVGADLAVGGVGDPEALEQLAACARSRRAWASFCRRPSSIRFSRPVRRSSSEACWPASAISSRTAPRLARRRRGRPRARGRRWGRGAW